MNQNECPVCGSFKTIQKTEHLQGGYHGMNFKYISYHSECLNCMLIYANDSNLKQNLIEMKEAKKIIEQLKDFLFIAK